MRDEWLERKFSSLELLFWFGVAGAVVLCLALVVFSGAAQVAAVFSAVVLIVPLIADLVLITIWHWKHRYRGSHSDLWGALLLIETSGWFKVVYWFRHILPDWRGKGRYATASTTQQTRR